MTVDWYTSDYPDLRPGPPWVMEEMIRSQAALPDGLAGLDAAHAIHDAASRALAAGDEVIVVGCGTSEHGAMAVAALLGDALATSRADAGRLRAQQALDAALDPPSTGLVIGVSPRWRDARHLARAPAARAARAPLPRRSPRAPESEFAATADHVLATPLLDRSWCHTVAYTSAIPPARRSRTPAGARLAGVGERRARSRPRRRRRSERRATLYPSSAC